MPISPENKSRYPENWKEIRAEIQARAGNKCEICGVKNHEIGYRGTDGTFYSYNGVGDMSDLADNGGRKRIEIVCTVMHWDHQPENNGTPGNRPNLKFGCQRCHNRHDAAHRAANRKKKKENL